MGRKLANAACDEEEFLLENIDLNFNGFFAKKRQKQHSKSLETSRMGPTMPLLQVLNQQD